MNIESAAPEANMGDIAGDMASRRGQVSGTDVLSSGMLAIKGHAPLADLVDYQTRLKSVTAGQGSFSIELSHYEPVPAATQKQLAEQHAKTAHAEED